MNFRRALYIIILFLPAYNVATVLVALTANQRLGSGECLPAHLRNRTHDDYSHLFKPFRWVPRSWTSWCFVEPPLLLLGNQKGTLAARNRSTRGPKPIPRPGEWQLSVVQLRERLPVFFLPYFAFTTKKGTHFSVGCRWDDTDHYYTFPRIALKTREGYLK